MIASDPHLLYTATAHLYGDPSTSHWPHAASGAIPLLSDFSCDDPAPSIATSSDPGNPRVEDIFDWNAINQHFSQQASYMDPETLCRQKEAVHYTPG